MGTKIALAISLVLNVSLLIGLQHRAATRRDAEIDAFLNGLGSGRPAKVVSIPCPEPTLQNDSTQQQILQELAMQRNQQTWHNLREEQRQRLDDARLH